MKQSQEYVLRGERIYVGLEDSKRSWKVCVRSGGCVVHEATMPAEYSVLQAYFRNKFPDCKVKLIYEAGFGGFWLHDLLTRDGVECIVTPPNKVTEQKANKVKTDKIDARRLATVLENNDYVACNVPEIGRREDRQLSRTLNQLQGISSNTKIKSAECLTFMA